MTTVAFITYKFHGADRRLGPMALERAEPFAKDLARRVNVTDVSIEEWEKKLVRKVGAP